MKQVSVIALLLMARLSLLGQPEFSPVNAEWFYRLYATWDIGEGAARLQYMNDTTINGLTMKVLRRTESTAQGTYSTSFVIYQSADTIYRALDYGNGLVLRMLFRNQMEVGEMVKFPILRAGEDFLVTEKDSIILSNQLVVRYRLSNQQFPNPFETYIYDKFGPEYGFFDHWLASVFDGYDYFLRCYRDEGFPMVNLTKEPCCAGANTAAGEPQYQQLSVHPNPVRDFLQIPLPKNTSGTFQLSIFDVAGQRVWKGGMSAEARSLDVRSLKDGLYFGTLEDTDQAFWFRFVKTE